MSATAGPYKATLGKWDCLRVARSAPPARVRWQSAHKWIVIRHRADIHTMAVLTLRVGLQTHTSELSPVRSTCRALSHGFLVECNALRLAELSNLPMDPGLISIWL